MPKNPVLQLVLLLVVVAWLAYDLFAPGEAQSRAVVIMEWVFLACGLLGIVTAIVRIAARK